MTTKSTSTNLTIKASHLDGAEEFKVNTENEVVLQEVKLASGAQSVTIEANGEGTALVQLTGSYYIEEQAERPAFSLEIEVKLWYTLQCFADTVEKCTAYSILLFHFRQKPIDAN